MSFDTLAPIYRSMEWLVAGGLMQRCRTSYLSSAVNARRALLLGEGPGRFLEVLLRVNPAVTVTCVESSRGMIAAARRRITKLGLDAHRVEFVASDALEWQGEAGNYDLVVTQFFLDCFRPEELQGLVARIGARTTADGQWLLADFRVPDRGWRRWRAKLLLALMYGFFRWATGLRANRLTSADAYLRQAGFELAGRRLVNFGFAHTDLWRRVTA